MASKCIALILVGKMQEKKYLVDLFSGCGGLSFGFEQAGFESVLGVDVDAPALKTFAKNHPHAKTLELDLSKDESVCEIVNVLGDKKIEIIVAGPPCQGFSLTGTRQENDKRNKLFYRSEERRVGKECKFQWGGYH